VPTPGVTPWLALALASARVPEDARDVVSSAPWPNNSTCYSFSPIEIVLEIVLSASQANTEAITSRTAPGPVLTIPAKEGTYWGKIMKGRVPQSDYIGAKIRLAIVRVIQWCRK
jgi:hypothetical protein